MIIVLGSVTLQPGRLDEALALSQEHVERWADRAALAAHFRVKASRQFVAALTTLSSAPPQITLYEGDEFVL